MLPNNNNNNNNNNKDFWLAIIRRQLQGIEHEPTMLFESRKRVNLEIYCLNRPMSL